MSAPRKTGISEDLPGTFRSLSPIRVALDARIYPQTNVGGVETHLVALAHHVAQEASGLVQLVLVCLPPYEAYFRKLLPPSVEVTRYTQHVPVLPLPGSPPAEVAQASHSLSPSKGVPLEAPASPPAEPARSYFRRSVSRRLTRWLGLEDKLQHLKRTLAGEGKKGVQLAARLTALENSTANANAMLTLEQEKLANRLEARRWEERPAFDAGKFWSSLGCHVVHFFVQPTFEVCSLPSVYNPHDLQHLHWPEYFAPKDIFEREEVYQRGCHFASRIAVASQWVKDDIIRHYHTWPDKIQVIPWAPTTSAVAPHSEEQVKQALDGMGIQGPFALYPAVTWPHKNHLRLIEALAFLRDSEGAKLSLICTGAKNEHWSAIQQRIHDLRLEKQVCFPGLVDAGLLRGLYRASQFIVVPTLFEAASGPIFEAWHEGKAVACSNVTSLPQQVGDAAVVFDPLQIESIASAMRQLTQDADLRSTLEERGSRRLKDFSWEQTARAYIALYRQVARAEAPEAYANLLKSDWMQQPKGQAP